MKFLLLVLLLSTPLNAVVWHAGMTEEDSRELAWSDKAFTATCKIIVKNRKGKVSITGTGVLIADRWVLTAKHLFNEQTDPKNITCEFERNPGAKRTARRSVSFSTHDPDIAIIELKSEAPRWIPRIPPYTEQDEVGSGIVFTKVGYGGIDSRSSKNNIRRAITNTYAKADDGWLFYQRNDKGKKPNPTKWEGSTAPGDSGGPAFISINGQWWVSSLTYGVTRDTGPRETRVSTQIDWIRETTGLPFPAPEPKTAE